MLPPALLLNVPYLAAHGLRRSPFPLCVANRETSLDLGSCRGAAILWHRRERNTCSVVVADGLTLDTQIKLREWMCDVLLNSICALPKVHTVRCCSSNLRIVERTE